MVKKSEKYWEKSEYRDIYTFKLSYTMEVDSLLIHEKGTKNLQAIYALRKFKDDIDSRIIELQKEK